MDHNTFMIVFIIDPYIPPEVCEQTIALLQVFIRLPPAQSQTAKGENSGCYSRVFGGGIIRPLRYKNSETPHEVLLPNVLVP